MLRELFVPQTDSTDEPLSNDGSFRFLTPGLNFTVEPKDRSFHLPLARSTLPPVLTFFLLLVTHVLVGLPPLFFDTYSNRVVYVSIMVVLVSVLGAVMEYFCVTRSFLPLSRAIRKVTKNLTKRQGEILEKLKRETEEFLEMEAQNAEDGGGSRGHRSSPLRSSMNTGLQLNMKTEVEWLHEELHTLIKKLPEKSSVTLRWQAPMLEALLGALHDIDMSLMQVAMLMVKRDIITGGGSSNIRQGRLFRKGSFVSLNSARQPMASPLSDIRASAPELSAPGNAVSGDTSADQHPVNSDGNPITSATRSPLLHSNPGATRGSDVSAQTGVSEAKPKGCVTTVRGPDESPSPVPMSASLASEESDTLCTVPEAPAGAGTDTDVEALHQFRDRMAAQEREELHHLEGVRMGDGGVDETESINLTGTQEHRDGVRSRGLLRPHYSSFSLLSLFRGDRFATDNKNVFFFIMLVRVKRGSSLFSKKPLSSSIILFEAETRPPTTAQHWLQHSRPKEQSGGLTTSAFRDSLQFCFVPSGEGKSGAAGHSEQLPYRAFLLDRATRSRHPVPPEVMRCIGLDCLGKETTHRGESGTSIERQGSGVWPSDTGQDPSDVTETRTPHQPFSTLPESYIMRWRTLAKRPMRLTFLQVMLHNAKGSQPPSPSEATGAPPEGSSKQMVPVLECEVDQVLSVLLSAVVTVDADTNELLSVKLRGSSIESSARSSADLSSWGSDSNGDAAHLSGGGGGRLEVGMARRETLLLSSSSALLKPDSPQK